MVLTYFKRYRMEMSLAAPPAEPRLPAGYRFIPWDHALLIDANVFPCLGDADGCYRLMKEIARKEGFLPAATWLVAFDQGRRQWDYCGTVQGIRDRSGFGAIQNLGITPEHRGRGLGSCLLMQAMCGFRRSGLTRAFLEVTAQNEGAIRLYRRLGFRKSRTVFKAVEVAYS